MSQNRVIGRDNRIPWHLPEDFKWFKRTTLGHVLVMGRKTFESMGGPLAGRETVVLSRARPIIPAVRVVSSLDDLDPSSDTRDYFVCGGAQVYELALPRCAVLYLTLVKRTVEGDAFFPAFEVMFELQGVIQEQTEFRILDYRRKPGLD